MDLIEKIKKELPQKIYCVYNGYRKYYPLFQGAFSSKKEAFQYCKNELKRSVYQVRKEGERTYFDFGQGLEWYLCIKETRKKELKIKFDF